MLMLRRLSVWVGESLLSLVLLGTLLRLYWGPIEHGDQVGFALQILRYIELIAIVFMLGSGYLFTTAVAGLTLRDRGIWLYPIVVALLLVVHLQFQATGWTLQQRLPIQLMGSGIVLVATFSGQLVLRAWSKSRAARSSN